MENQPAIEQIRASCKTLSGEITRIHPEVPKLGDKPAQDELYKALFALTREVEVIKKQLAKLERRDDTAEL